MPTSASSTPLTIEHLADRGRFQVAVDGAACELEYRLHAGVMNITHTGVAPRVQGRGIAAALMRAALDQARTAGWKVRPLCSYARVYMQRHPETGDLLA